MTTAEIQVKPEDALARLREEREQGEARGCFYLVGHRPGEETTMVVVPCIEPIGITAALIPAMASAENMTIDSVAIACDTYRYLDPEPLSEDLDMGEMFSQGDPRVTEALVVACVDKDTDGFYVTQPYIASEFGVVWGDPELFTGEADLADPAAAGMNQGMRQHRSALTSRLESLLR